ncbi:hypothetical protein EDF68_11711 [Ochrobactrum sp. BH3]|nr:hypothetical protein EDF68_11711 [Ochrobactrum sp. BH3]
MKGYFDFLLEYYFNEDNRRSEWAYDLVAFLIAAVMIFYKTQFPLEISMLIAVPCAFAFRFGLLTLKFLLKKYPG